MSEASRQDQALAIVGIGCRWPGGADTPQRFWELLCEGRDAITEVPPARFDVEAIFDEDPSVPGKLYSRWGGFLEQVDRFDADFFGIAPREAKRMDPQHRLLLEVVWEALEDGGQVPERLAGSSTGVFVGIASHDYSDLHMAAGRPQSFDAHVNIGNGLCVAANRLSYVLDLRGPSIALDTACSSSLTALHLARRSLAAGDCRAAIVAGVNVLLAPQVTIGFCKASMIARGGRCRAFDAGAEGYVRSEGAGAVVLKPLAAARADGDPIYAVVRGTAVNEDGRTTGISLPSADAQERLMREALREAEVDPAEVHYVEAHGTGTAAGDPIEADALGRVYGRAEGRERDLVIGSAKTNVGHVEAGAGMVGLVKASLMLRHRQVPASLHFERPNPDIPFDQLRLRVPTALEAWPEAPGPAFIGVSASGFGGANAHVILEEPPVSRRPPDEAGSRAHLLALSARHPEALQEAAERTRDLLRGEAPPAPRDLCYTAATRRSHHDRRLAVVGSDVSELADALDGFLAGEPGPEVAHGRAVRGRVPKLAFTFAGMGPQWWAMGRQLLEEEPVFREAIEACDRSLRPVSGWSLLEELTADEEASRLSETRVVQVVNCALQIALAALWRSWGVVPDAVVGHSAGEMAAAHVAGALSLHDALRIAYHRGMLLHRASGAGTMLAAGVGEQEAAALLAPYAGRASLAAINSPNAVTFSGETEALREVARELERRERFCRFLATDVPYHSPLVEGVREELLEALADVEPQPARIPMLSAVTGTWLGDAPLDAAYWWRNIREPVRFAPCVEALLDEGYDLFCEISPHPALAHYVSEGLGARGTDGDVVPSLRRHADERSTMLRALARLHVRGVPIDWSAVHPEGSVVTLPSYPWQRERHWFEDDEPDAPKWSARGGVETGHPLLGRRLPAPRPTWEVSLNRAEHAFLEAHVVQGAVLFPGAGYLEMAAAAGRELWPGETVVLEDVRFRQMLFPGSPPHGVLQLQHQPSDGRTEIHALQGDDGTDWTLHATARVRHELAHEPERIDVDELRARCSRPLSADEHYAFFERSGYHFGDAFRTVREAWLGTDEALARVAFPPGVTVPVGGYHTHPALLDGVLQVWAAAVRAHLGEDNPGENAFFPVSVRRLVFRQPPGDRFWVHGAVRSGDADARPEDLEADARILNDHGEVVAVLEGLRMRVLGEAAPREQARFDDVLYELRWEEDPVVSEPAGAEGLRRVADAAGAVEARRGPPEEDDARLVRYLELVEPRLERATAGFAAAALEALGGSPERDAGRPPDEVARELGVVPRHNRLLAALLELLRPEIGGEGEAPGDAVAPPRDVAALNAMLDELVAVEPGHAPEVELLRLGGTNLAGVLRGDVDPREVLLSEDGLELMRRFYTDSAASRAYHELLKDTVAALADGDGGPLRVLEVGAGTGAATEAVLPQLPPGSTYTFTDVSPHFLETARARFSDRQELRFATLDIERDPVGQGFEPHAYDLVLAANVLHTTEELDASLRNVRRLLAGNGVLALLELTHDCRWPNLVFGLLDGWWRYRDERRSHGPAVDAERWRELLEATGFQGVVAPFGTRRQRHRVQTLQLAHAPVGVEADAGVDAAPPAGRWLVLADTAGVADHVVRELRRAGEACTWVRPGATFVRTGPDAFELPPEDEDAHARLAQRASGDGGPLRVLHLWSVDDTEELDGEALVERQLRACMGVRALLRALDATDAPLAEMVFVTAGAQAVPGHDAAPHLAQAPLWGLGRSLINDRDDVRFRLIDLPPRPALEDRVALAAELRAGGEDEEAALRGGARWIRRLRRVSLAERTPRGPVTLRSPEDAAFRLEVASPGVLESALLREVPEVEPAPNEVVIRVLASGLNFFDVLQGLDMLPPDAGGTERDPEAMGFECAGVVLACGRDVERLRPGDEVMAMAHGAHANRARAPQHLTITKPQRTSFEQAAALLGGFVTADYALNDVARIRPGERVLIHSATGGVGLAALQICREQGAEVFATAGTPEKRDYLRNLGVQHVMDSRSLAFADEVLRDTAGEGVDVVLNSLSGEAIRKGLAVLRPYGRFVELGKRDLIEDAQLGLAPFRRNLSFHAVDLIPLTALRPRTAQDLMERVAERIDDGTWQPIPTTSFDLAEAEAALRLMAQAKHVGKIVLTSRGASYPVHARGDAPLVRRDGSYLITGGLGGFGLAVADWLARRGAGAIVLMSRSGVAHGGDDALEALREGPAEVRLVRGDVADVDDVRRVLGEIRSELPPLRGVFHAAMVLDDDDLDRLDRERFRRVLAPKAAGGWNLHALTRDDPLEHFVAFSSVSGVLGGPKQANYAAANVFLDTLAAHRRASGLPGLSVSWGALEQVGYVARHPELGQYLGRGGFHTFTPARALAVLEALLRHDLAHVMAADLDWRGVSRVYPAAAASPRFRHLSVAGSDTVVAGVPSSEGALPRLRAAGPAERPELLGELLARKVARILGASPERVDLDRPFTELGFDSLMAVELTSALRTELGVQVPVVAILQGTDGRGLVERLLGELALDDGEDAPAPDGEPVAAPAAVARVPAQTTSPMQPNGADQELPLASEQRRFWFLERLHGGTAAHHISVAIRLGGALDVDALRRGLDQALARHETLRAALREVDGTPVQRFLAPEPVPLTRIELGRVEADGREAELQRRATEEIRRPFDLGRGPLLHAALFGLAPEEHVLLLVVHHIASDAWAMQRLVAEIATSYDAFSRGEPSPLPPPTARYREHLERQAGADEASMEAQLAYWRRQLADLPARLPLPALRPSRPAAGGRRGAHLPFELSEEATAALRALSRREGVTPFMTLLAAFQTLLHRWSGADDVPVGTAVSTRDHPGSDAVVGCCLNTLVLRGALGGDPTFRELLARVRRTTLEAFEHQEVPFDRVVEALGSGRGRAGEPPFQAMLVLHGARPPELRLPGLRVEPVPVESGAAVTELALLLDDGERLTGTVEYDADVFDRDTIEALAEQLATLLVALPEQAERPISALALGAVIERERTLLEPSGRIAGSGAAKPERAVAEGNGPDSASAEPVLLHELVRAQARRTPDAVAVEDGHARLTYEELERRTSRFAHRLRALGVGPDVPVGVHLPRSLETVVAALAVLEAGGAYLPLDPQHPPERLRGMLADARAPVLITDREGILEVQGVQVVLLEGHDEGPVYEPETLPAPVGVTPQHLAYVIYTSGSTGAPKGVAVPHGAIVNQLSWRQKAFPLAPGDVVVQRTPLGFDPAVWELFGPLAAGARVVLPRPGLDGDAAALVGLLSERAVSVLQVTPSLLGVLLEQPGLEACSGLAHVFCGGESLPPALVRRFFARLPGAELHHLYGPAEATIDATHWRCRPEDGERAFVPIGRPIAGVRVHLLDRRGEAVPIGVPGELHIGGRGVARGYLNRPELDAERFVPDPFAERPEALLYRTGDRARRWPDGSLEFLGRVDRQVKVRGMRVEPAEVEAVLRAHPAVRDAAVVAWPGGSGEETLAAFAVTDEATPARLLREYAAARLPAYMVPAVIQPMGSLPRTAHDKVDREELLVRARTAGASGRERVAPRNDVELQLLRVWEAFLPGRGIGVTDDFFEVGGHSLLAMRVLARIRSVFGRELPVASLFEGRTVERQAELLRESAVPRGALIAIEQRDEGRPVFCVHPVSGSTVCYAELGNALGRGRPVYGLDALGLLGLEPHERIEEMAASYLAEVRRVAPTGPYQLIGWSMGGAVALEMARLLAAHGGEVVQLAVLDGWVPVVPGDEDRDEHGALMAAFGRELGLPPHDLARAVGEDGEVAPEERVARVLRRARELSLVPPDLRSDDSDARWRTFAANLRAMRAYEPRPYAGPVTLLEAEEPIDGVARRGPRWEELATGGVTRHRAPGNHYTMLRRPHVDAVAAILRERFASPAAPAS